MKEFDEITIHSIWVKISGRLWRFQYRFRRKIERMQAKSLYKVLKDENRPRVYRIEIR